MVSNDRIRKTLQELKSEIHWLALSSSALEEPRFISWRSRTQSVLEKVLGAEHAITRNFASLRWAPATYRPERAWIERNEAFQPAAKRAEGYLDAALAELDWISDVGVLDAAGVDPELWQFVAADIEGENWGKAATQTTLFLEDRIRRWTAQPADLVGEKLSAKVFGPGSEYRLGLTDGEKDGWQLFAMGVFKALRNAAVHRIDDRPDHRRYVLGVLGACSLLLTQLRHEHSSRLHNVSSAMPDRNHKFSKLS